MEIKSAPISMFCAEKLKPIVQSPWFLSLLLALIYYLVTGYQYGWDDQHLEIPLLKHLIDPSLYQGDYYVESLARNFPSYFYQILSRLITVDQIPAAYFTLYLISRYVLFYWIYQLWLLISKSRFQSFLCGMVFILMSRVQEFLYRTFSHQEFALAIIFAGIYFFYKERFALSALLLGIAANFHALYSLFPMSFLCVYLLWQIRSLGIKPLLKSSIIFTVSALPFIIWVAQKRFLAPPPDGGAALYKDWIYLYTLACPQNFIFPDFPLIPFKNLFSDAKIFYHAFEPYIFLAFLFTLNLKFNRVFRTDKKSVAFCSCAFFWILVSFFFTYFIPNRFVLDLNLIRNTQYLHFLLMGYLTLFLIKTVKESKPVWALVFALLFMLLKYGELIGNASLLIMLALLTIRQNTDRPKNIARSLMIGFAIAAIVGSLAMIFYAFNHTTFKVFPIAFMICIFALLILTYFWSLKIPSGLRRATFNNLFIVIPIAVFFLQYSYYHLERIELNNHPMGFWRMQQSWEDMQRFVSDHTPKEAMLLVPYNMEMGGFRIQSNRKIVVSYRDCGIIGFDYKAAVEWRRRINDVEAFKYNMTESPRSAIKNAILKYKADYIVFMRYVMPGDQNSLLERVYTNMDFALFKVKQNPKPLAY